jgi:PhnB protein
METRTADVKTEIIPYIYCGDVAAALDWLARAFGFKEEMREPTPRGGVHGEMTLDGRRIMLGQRPGSHPTNTRGDLPVTQAIFGYLADVDAHFERARAAGARIDKAPEDLPYGRSYGARDLEAMSGISRRLQWGRPRTGTRRCAPGPPLPLSRERAGVGGRVAPSFGASRHLLRQQREKGSPLRRG